MTTAGLGVPVKLLHESLGHIITVELKTGQLYRGKLAEGTHAHGPWTWMNEADRCLVCSRGQSQYLVERYYGHRTRWPRFTVRSSVYSGEHGQVFHCS